MTKPFSGQVAIITGAGSGIGRATALALAEHGAGLCLIGRNGAGLHSVATETGRQSCCRLYEADLCDDARVDRLGDELLRDCGHIHILIHNAAVISLGEIASLPVEELDRQYHVNLRAPFALTQRLLPKLKNSHGQIVFVNSTAALRPGAKSGQYAATKASLRALADSLRDEVNSDGVRVLSVFIGRTATRMQEAVHKFEGRPFRPDLLMQPSDVAAMIIGALATPRTAEVTEIVMRPMHKS